MDRAWAFNIASAAYARCTVAPGTSGGALFCRLHGGGNVPALAAEERWWTFYRACCLTLILPTRMQGFA